MHVGRLYCKAPKEVVEKMKKYREVNWSEVVRTAIEEHLRRLEELRTEEPALEALERPKIVTPSC